MGKVKSGFKSVTKTVDKGLKQIDPTTKTGLANLSTGGMYGMTKNAVDKGLKQIDPTTKTGLANLSTGGMYGAHKNAFDKMTPKEEKDKPSEHEKAAGEVAIKEYDFAREMDFVKDEYQNRIERLGSNQMHNSVMGKANISAQTAANNYMNEQAGQLQAGGVDPSSGRAVTAMTSATANAGDAIGNAKSQSQFALDNAYLEGRNNRIAMAMGEKTKAVAGLQDIAAGANAMAINKANNRFNSNAANAQAIGTAVGMGSQAYLGRDKKGGG